MNRSFICRWLRRGFVLCAGLIVLLIVSLLVAREVVDQSGKRRWAAVQEMLAREGESLDFRKIAPDPVPDDQNFCAIPALKDLPLALNESDKTSPLALKRLRLMNTALPDRRDGPDYSQGATSGRPVDLEAWAAYLRKPARKTASPDSGNPARDVLASLSQDDALIGELSLGLPRPDSQWTPSWKTRPLPDLLYNISVPEFAPVANIDPMLGLRAVAEARAGNAAAAHQSLLIAVRLIQALGKEPGGGNALFISSGIYSRFLCNTAWELCYAHCGTAEDFRALQQEFVKLDYKAFSLLAQRAQMAFSINALERLKQTQQKDGFTSAAFPSLMKNRAILLLLPRLIPDGWFDGNAALIMQWYHDYFIKPLRDEGPMKLLNRNKDFNAALKKYYSPPPFQSLGEALTPFFPPGYPARFVIYTQCLLNESIAACALERYRIGHGTYPDALEAVNLPGEANIPLDIISGKPMGYRKTADGRYALWCVGFDRTDDGGKRVLAKDPWCGDSNFPSNLGDWVWDFAPAAAK